MAAFKPETRMVTRILVVGGGFGGISAIQRLEKLFGDDPFVSITLVSRENFLLFTPMLSEVAIGAVDPRHIVTPIREVCRKTRFYRGDVLDIDLHRQEVLVRYNGVAGCEDTLPYDHLVLALGSQTDMSMVPGAATYAINFKSMGDALVLRNHILEMLERAEVTQNPAEQTGMLTFCVIGGSYSGVEIAAAIQDLAHRSHALYPCCKTRPVQVVLVEAKDRLLATMPQNLSAYAYQVLTERGIRVLLNAKVQEVRPTDLVLDTGEVIAAYTAVWATGVVIPPLIRGLPVTKEPRGLPLSTPELRLCGFNNVWGVGDNILTPFFDREGYYLPTAQVAVRQGRHVADNLHRAVTGRYLKPFRFKQKGIMVVLGERSAVALIGGKAFKGFGAWLLWRLFYLSQLPRWKKKLRVATDWLLNLFGPPETTQIKIEFRQEPCDTLIAECSRLQEKEEPGTIF